MIDILWAIGVMLFGLVCAAVGYADGYKRGWEIGYEAGWDARKDWG
jgi:steroid 5-alpha reductase family enzyme